MNDMVVAAWVQAASTIALLLVTGFYAVQTYRLEQREAQKDVRQRRALAFPILRKADQLLTGLQHIRAMTAQSDPFNEKGALVATLPHHSTELVQMTLDVDATLAAIAMELEAGSRSWEVGESRSNGYDAAPGLQRLIDRATAIVRGQVDPI